MRRFEVAGRYSVMTTHSDPRGVAKGVIEVFRNVLERSRVDPATSSFLRTARRRPPMRCWKAMWRRGHRRDGESSRSVLARGQSSIKEIELAPGVSSAHAPLHHDRQADRRGW